MFPDYILLSSLNFKSFGPKFHNLLGLFFETRFLLCFISLGLYLLQRLTSNLARFFGRTRSAIEIIKVRNYARKSENTLKTIIWEWKNTLWSLVRLAALHIQPAQFPGPDSNPGPFDWEANALPLSYIPSYSIESAERIRSRPQKQ